MSAWAQLPIAGLLLALLPVPVRAEATSPERQHLAVGRFRERGPTVADQGPVLAEALAWALSRSGAYRLVAGRRAIADANAKILEINRASTDDGQWVELGRSIGATHLLVGDLRGSRPHCLASAQVVELATKEVRAARPEPYDCTPHDLIAVAATLAAHLTGRPSVGPPAHPVRLPPPLEIVVHEDDAEVDGRPVRLERSRAGRPDAGSGEPRSADRAPTEVPARPPPPPPERPRWPDLEPGAPPPEPVPPPAGPAPEAGAEATYGLRDFGRDLARHRDAIVLLVLGLPALALGFAALTRRRKPAWSRRAMRQAFVFSGLALLVELGVLMFYRRVLGGDPWGDVDFLLLASPPLALVGLVLGLRRLI